MVFPDHYNSSAATFEFSETTSVNAEKDAVKCMAFAAISIGILPVKPFLNRIFLNNY